MPKPGSPTVKLSESAAGAARAARARSAPAPQARAPAAPAEGPLNFTMVKLGWTPRVLVPAREAGALVSATAEDVFLDANFVNINNSIS